MKFNWKNGIKLGVIVFFTYLAISHIAVFTSLFTAVLSALKPLIVGAFIAFVVNIPMSFFEKVYFPKMRDNKVVVATRRPVSLICAIICILALLYFLLAMVIPELVRCFGQLINKVPAFYNNIISSDFITEWIPEHLPYLVENFDFKTLDIQGLIQKSIQLAGEGIGGVFNFSFSLVASAFSTVISTIVSIIFSIYLLIGKDKLKNQFKRFASAFLKPSHYRNLIHIIDVTLDSFKRFFVGQFTEAIILGLLCTVGMLIFRFPYATMIGVLIGFTALIPVAGAYIGAVLGVIMILTESSLLTAILFVVFIIVLQQLEGNIIYPKVVGNSVGLPAIWVLFAVTFGGVIGGILGMLVSVPIFASAYKLIREYVLNREKTLKEKP